MLRPTRSTVIAVVLILLTTSNVQTAFITYGARLAGAGAPSLPMGGAMPAGHTMPATSYSGQAMPNHVTAQAAALITFPGTNLRYSPADVVIDQGQAVQWQADAGADFSGHPLVSDESLWQVQNIGTSFVFTFTQAGLYHFHCQIHGPLGMVGTVTVRGPLHTFMPISVR